MSIIDTPHPPGPAPVGGAFHNIGEIVLALLVLGGIYFAVTRRRRGRRVAPRDDT